MVVYRIYHRVWCGVNDNWYAMQQLNLITGQTHEERVMNITKLIPPERSKDYAYKIGFDSSINGANTTNCHFSIFSSPKNTKAWEEGVKDGITQKGEK